MPLLQFIFVLFVRFFEIVEHLQPDWLIVVLQTVVEIAVRPGEINIENLGKGGKDILLIDGTASVVDKVPGFVQSHQHPQELENEAKNTIIPFRF